jgi:Glycosyltransferase family 87
VLVTAASLLAWPDSSPLEPLNAGHPTGDAVWAWWFLALLAAAFAAYVGGILLLRRRPSPRPLVAALACAVQLGPLAAPLLLSTDAWVYWDYGRLSAVHDLNPYEHTPEAAPDDPAFPYVGSAWRDSISVYGPAFTLASEPLALAAGSSADAAAWIYKVLAAVAVLAAAFLASRLSPRPALALAFVGWNPLLAVHFAGGGHNDAWLAALVVAALACGAAQRPRLAGACWALAVGIKWIPLVFLPLRALQARATGRRIDHVGLLAAAAVVAALAIWRYGFAWIHVFGRLFHNAGVETKFALPHRLTQLGVPHGVAVAVFAIAFVALYVLLLRRAARGANVLALAACGLLLATPYLTVWYIIWAIPLAAAEDDERAGIVTLALGAYLLRQTIPL